MYPETNLKGVIAAAVTPLDAGFDIDGTRLAALCVRMLDAGCSYVSVFGTTGEGASLSSAQKLDALDALAVAGVDMARLIPGVISSQLDEAARMLAGAADRGCRAALVMPPYYYEPSGHEGVAAFYDALVTRAGAPETDLLLYQFPRFSGIDFTPDLVRAVLARMGNQIVGIKDSTGDLPAGLTLIDEFPALSIFAGNAKVATGMVGKGGAGMIASLCNLYPEECVEIVAGAGDNALRQRAHDRVDLIARNGGVLAVKAVLAAQIADPDFARAVPPLRAWTAEQTAGVAAELATIDAT